MEYISQYYLLLELVVNFLYIKYHTVVQYMKYSYKDTV